MSLDRQAVSRTGQVLCPLRDATVAVAKCLLCQRLIDKDAQVPPRYVVCDARMVTGWLGVDDL